MRVGAHVWSRNLEWEERALPESKASREESFATLVTQHSRFMFRVAYGVLRNSHDAEDAVQEAFLKLYRGEAWRELRDEKAFLARTVWRVAVARSTSWHRSTDVLDSETPSDEANPEQAATGTAERALLRRMILGLPSELREVLVLSALKEMNSREIGIVLGIPEGTVRTRVMRAKTELRKRFNRVREAGQ